MNRNYSKELDALIEKNKKDGVVPKLMLHACCACCMSYVLEYLSPYFDITVLFYNPNITEEEEYNLRLQETKRLVTEMPLERKVEVIAPLYDPQNYLSEINGHEDAKEGGSRCAICFDMRLRVTAEFAKQYDCDYFATTLTISPLKNSSIINSIGEKVAQEYVVSYLSSDFKKKEGYKRSIELSKEYNLYRQNYCGCVFSKQK